MLALEFYSFQVPSRCRVYRVTFEDKDCEDDENTELCKKEVSEGYPTIKLNGEEYSGERTKEALSEFIEDMLQRLTGSN